MEIGITLPMGMADRVDRRAVDEERDVRPVIEVEASQEVLLRLAPSCVLHAIEPGNGSEHVLGPEAGTEHELCTARGRVGRGDALGLHVRRSEGAFADDRHGLGRRLLEGWTARIGVRARHRNGCGRRRHGRGMELVGELHDRRDRDTVRASGREDRPLDRVECRLVEAVPLRRHDARPRYAAVFAHHDLDLDGCLESVRERVGRIKCLRARGERRRRHCGNAVRSAVCGPRVERRALRRGSVRRKQRDRHRHDTQERAWPPGHPPQISGGRRGYTTVLNMVRQGEIRTRARKSRRHTSLLSLNATGRSPGL